MATTVKSLYTATSAMTITLASLAASSARESTAVSNTATNFLDAMVTVKFQTSLVTGADNAVYLYTYGSEDGATFESPCTGSDAAVLTTPSIS